MFVSLKQNYGLSTTKANKNDLFLQMLYMNQGIISEIFYKLSIIKSLYVLYLDSPTFHTLENRKKLNQFYIDLGQYDKIICDFDNRLHKIYKSYSSKKATLFNELTTFDKDFKKIRTEIDDKHNQFIQYADSKINNSENNNK